jgi:hemolysin activation/secretion protein
VELHGETGDASFGRPLVRLGAETPLVAGIGAGVSLAAGTGFGTLPVQRLWQIGGATTVRGHDPASLRGESVWLARAELTRGRARLPHLPLGDAGVGGGAGRVLRVAPAARRGVGVALLDNLFRVDLAHGFDGGGPRLHLRMGGGI